jgi:hypothetical protein
VVKFVGENDLEVRQSAILDWDHRVLIMQPAHSPAFIRYRPAWVDAGNLRVTVETMERGLSVVVKAIMPDVAYKIVGASLSGTSSCSPEVPLLARGLGYADKIGAAHPFRQRRSSLAQKLNSGSSTGA